MAAEGLRLTVVAPSGAVASYRFAGGRVRIGRDTACELRIDDAEVSRVHAEIQREDSCWMLRDGGSRNGTRRNGRTIAGPTALGPGDEIGLGGTRIVFDADPEDGARSRTTRHSPCPRDIESALRAVGIVGSSPAIRAVVETARRVAPATCPVLVLGENGTGKELIARLLHEASPRADGPFVVVNCPALPGTLLEAELFGVERGVATGVEPRLGRFETAEGGTLVLDEVGDLEPSAQAKLLRVLETKTIDRIGGRKLVAIDVRIVAATNHDLHADVDAGRFRLDLYHRLDSVTIRLPPLRERREDVPELLSHFVARSSRPGLTFSPEALGLLAAYEFPGNVRELAHIIDRACLLADGPVVGAEDLGGLLRRRGAEGAGRAADLYRRVVQGGESFWDVVAEPYLRREISREDAERFVDAARAASGGSYRALAHLLRLDGEYKRLLNFLNHHRIGKPPARDESRRGA